MKTLRHHVIIVLFFLANLSYGQTDRFVDKDYRINKYEDSAVDFLKREQQFGIIKMQLKTTDYEGMIYITKKLELFGDAPKNVLLTQFGSLADHAGIYWALFTSDSCFFFYKISDLGFKRFVDRYDRKTVAIIRTYIKLNQSDTRDVTHHLVTDE